MNSNELPKHPAFYDAGIQSLIQGLAQKANIEIRIGNYVLKPNGDNLLIETPDGSVQVSLSQLPSKFGYGVYVRAPQDYDISSQSDTKRNRVAVRSVKREIAGIED